MNALLIGIAWVFVGISALVTLLVAAAVLLAVWSLVRSYWKVRRLKRRIRILTAEGLAEEIARLNAAERERLRVVPTEFADDATAAEWLARDAGWDKVA